jgi:hypothetical protein
MREEASHQSFEDHRVCNVRHMELVKADKPMSMGNPPGHLIKRISLTLKRFQLAMHCPHKFMEMQPGFATNWNRPKKAVHQKTFAAPYAAIKPDASRHRGTANQAPQQTRALQSKPIECIAQLLQTHHRSLLGRVGHEPSSAQGLLVGLDDVQGSASTSFNQPLSARLSVAASAASRMTSDSDG